MFVAVLLALDTFVTLAQANGFLSAGAVAGQFNSEILFEQLESVSGPEFREAAERRAPAVQDYLRVTFAALPKNAHGRIDSTVSIRSS